MCLANQLNGVFVWVDGLTSEQCIQGRLCIIMFHQYYSIVCRHAVVCAWGFQVLLTFDFRELLVEVQLHFDDTSM